MDIIKIALGITSSIFILLLGTMIFIQDTSTTLYEQTIETLKRQENLPTTQAVLDRYPELVQVKAQVDRIHYLSGNIQRMTEGPAPNIDADDSQLIRRYRSEVQYLQSIVQERLTRLLLTQIVDASCCS
ncbi:MAG: hypothetical protein AAGJ82_10335 [Bacteroidota bacterium]